MFEINTMKNYPNKSPIKSQFIQYVEILARIFLDVKKFCLHFKIFCLW